jgi:chemotaxis regulatin CheY-phosphate phosphatase CheZ
MTNQHLKVVENIPSKPLEIEDQLKRLANKWNGKFNKQIDSKESEYCSHPQDFEAPQESRAEK